LPPVARRQAATNAGPGSVAYLGRRVRELPVALVLAARPALPGEDRAVLEVIAADAEALAPAPLTAAAIGVLAARRFGSRTR